MMGRNPKYDFATTFKVKIDELFIAYLSTDSLLLEINQTKHLDYTTIARTEIPLFRLLESRPTMILLHQPLYSPSDGSVVGSAHIEIRMAIPVNAVYKALLEKNPEFRRIAEDAHQSENNHDSNSRKNSRGRSSLNYANNVFGGEPIRLENELDICVVNVSKLSLRPISHLAPCPYVHYQLLGFPDSFTPVAEQDTQATFLHSTKYPITTDGRLLRFLKKYTLKFTVMDYSNKDFWKCRGYSSTLSCKKNEL